MKITQNNPKKKFTFQHCAPPTTTLVEIVVSFLSKNAPATNVPAQLNQVHAFYSIPRPLHHGQSNHH